MATRRYLDRLEVVACRERIKRVKKENPFLGLRPREANLEHLAVTLGGREAMIAYARLSRDKRVRLVVRVWDSLSMAKRHRTSLAVLCVACRIEEEELLAGIITGLADSGYDPAPLVQRNLAVSQKLQDGSISPPRAGKYFEALSGVGAYPGPT